MNVLSGERYKLVSNEVRSYLRGEYGHAPGKVNEEVLKKVLGDEVPMTGRFADTLPPAFEAAKEKLKGTAKNDEDVLSYLVFPQIAEKYFAQRDNPEQAKPAAAPAAAAPAKPGASGTAVRYSVRRVQ
jgi:oxaloacetate decarboxylase alpha subunit